MNKTSADPQAPNVLMIGSEAVPFAKTGGLGDVLGALPVAISRLGWPVTLVLPRYRGVTDGTLIARLPITIGAYRADVGFYEAALDAGARALLVDCPDLYDREALYAPPGAMDYPDNPRRFAMLVRAALEFASRLPAVPRIVHAHDWQTALAPVYLKTVYASHPAFAGARSMLTIHNLAYQGQFEADWLPRLDLPWSLLAVDRLEFWGRISLLKGGITDADVITTVSRQYARETQTPDFGVGLDGVLRARSADYVGILNGIDDTVWDPACDPFLPQPFSRADLSGKPAAKREILARYRLPTDEEAMARPLVGMVSRMVDQKGFDLLAWLGDELAMLGAAWVVLGTGEPKYESFWTALAARHPDRVGAQVGFDEGAAHLIEAGADVFLMPSRFEPCGLNQMYSLRYGTVPVVHGVGGLLDTVTDQTAESGANGFVFREYTAAALRGALQRALAVFRDKGSWGALQAAGMAMDNSWDRSAREYVTIYKRLLAGAPGGGDSPPRVARGNP
jgi:starch synthase